MGNPMQRYSSIPRCIDTVLSETSKDATNELLRLHRSDQRTERCAAPRRSVPHMPPYSPRGVRPRPRRPLAERGSLHNASDPCTKSMPPLRGNKMIVSFIEAGGHMG
jgi:hypothetical protein